MEKIEELLKRALQLHQSGRLLEARTCYEQILKENSSHARALNLLGATYIQTGEHQKGLPFFEQALAIKPDLLEAYNNLGIALKVLKRHEEAVGCYQKALMLKPNYALGYFNLGIALKELNRHEEAVANYRQALAIKTDYADAYNNLGIALKDLERYEEAVDCYQKALALNPNYALGYYNLGELLKILQRHEDAANCIKKALSINPDIPFALGMYLNCQMHCCNWDGIDDTICDLLDGVDAGKKVSDPFSVQAIPSTGAQQKKCSEIFVQEKFAWVAPPSNVHSRYAHNKIRLGYFSADFYDHPVGKLTAEMFERHDRSKFEIFGFSFSAPKNDPIRQRLTASLDHFIDIRNQSDKEIATLAKRFEIDIAVDLTGHTANSRTGIFALRPAPIQVKFLGDPGTMGAAYIDYLIADPTVIPVDHRQFYSEKIAYLPNSYLVNGSHRQISERQFSRSEMGLPDTGFVFCGFNANFKITPTIFDLWMQLLKQIEGSVLWLTEGNATVKQNLRDEARKRGIAPERIVFAKRMDALSDHLARYQLADLFLDTIIFNAHTTASDALWAGLPVLTCLGDTFAGRVAASLLNAIGLPELIARTREEYKAIALELATSPEKLALLKQRLARNRLTHPLFDTTLFTRHIEDAFTQMWKRQQEFLLPDHIHVRQHKITDTLT